VATPILYSTNTPAPVYEGSFCAYSTGSIEDVSIESTLLTRPLAVKIYLPPCYAKTQSPGYPVLYMFHGQTFENDQWQRLGLLTAADNLILAGSIKPMIIVMPYDLSWTIGPENSSFDDAFLQDLIPYVEENYNSCPTRSCRAVGGLSRGGNWAVYLGFEHPEFFTAMGAHSAPLFYGEIPRISTMLQSEDLTGKLPGIYVDVGNSDENIDQVLAYVNLLKKYNVPYQFTEFKGYHSEDYWKTHVEDYLTWYSSQFVINP
jgi:enterochelin esterase-like enzyme